MDPQLVVRAQGGDRAAFASIVGLALPGLDRVARLITRDPDRAKDAVQEALVKAWRDLPALREPARFDAWLRQLLVRSCMDELRRSRRMSGHVELIEMHHPVIGDVAMSVGDRDALERAFRRLDPEQRALVVLHYYQDLALDEAAAALRIPVGTAKSRLSRARDTLRAALEADARPARAAVGGQI
jgi:RNA polymerase sigma-70 factor (ECF subfamily)